MAEAQRKVVLGLGNLLSRDEGLGVHLLADLRATGRLDAAVELIDGGTLGLNLLPLVEECSHLLLLDAVDAGKPAGTVVDLAKQDIPLYTNIKLSQHQATFQEVLGLASFRGKLPQHLHLVGVQPADLTVGLELSATIAAAQPEAVSRCLAVLESWELLIPDHGAANSP